MSAPVAADRGVEALQSVLAAEHATIFVYAALGARTSQSAESALFDRITHAYRIHNDRRAELRSMIADLDAEPVAAEPGYELPIDLGARTARTAHALRLEESMTEHYAYLVATTSGAHRAWASSALVDAAVRGLGFGGRPDRLPGV